MSSIPLNLTSRAANVLQIAAKEASDLGHEYVGTEHVLLGLIAEHDGVAAQILMNMRVHLDDVRSEVRRLVKSNKPSTIDELREAIAGVHLNLENLSSVMDRFVAPKTGGVQ